MAHKLRFSRHSLRMSADPHFCKINTRLFVAAVDCEKSIARGKKRIMRAAHKNPVLWLHATAERHSKTLKIIMDERLNLAQLKRM